MLGIQDRKLRSLSLHMSAGQATTIRTEEFVLEDKIGVHLKYGTFELTQVDEEDSVLCSIAEEDLLEDQ